MAEIEQIDFIWAGKDKAGNKAGGQISAKNESIARTDLRKMGIRVLKIKADSTLKCNPSVHAASDFLKNTE